MAYPLLQTVIIPGSSTGGTSSAVDSTGTNFIAFAITIAITKTPVVSDSYGNTWSLVLSKYAPDAGTILYTCFNPTVGPGHTFTVAGSPAPIFASGTVSLFEKGTTATGDVSSSASNTSTINIQPGSITPSQNFEIIITSLANIGQAGSTASINSGFTLLGQQTCSASYYANALAYKYQLVAAAENPTWTNNTATPFELATLQVAFKFASTETATAVLGLSGVGFAGGGGRKETSTANLALSGVSFNAAAGRKETATANLALRGVSFNSIGSITHIKGVGNFALRGVSITASGFNAGAPGGLRQFWTC